MAQKVSQIERRVPAVRFVPAAGELVGWLHAPVSASEEGLVEKSRDLARRREHYDVALDDQPIQRVEVARTHPTSLISFLNARRDFSSRTAPLCRAF